MDFDFWTGKRVLVTGHTGFKGGWLCLWLQELGAEVTGFALAPPTEPSLFELARVGDGMTHVEGDVRDLDALLDLFEVARPEIVLHLASQAIVRQSYVDPVETFASNVLGTAHLLEAVRRTGFPRAVVAVTSDKCYENVEQRRGYVEGDRLGGRDPYSASKACAEIVTRSFRRSFFTEPDSPQLATGRAGNVIGGGDWARDRLVPDVMRALIDEEPVFVRYPKAVRPWQFVLDPLAGYLALAQSLWRGGSEFAGPWNFAPRDLGCLPVGQLVERLASQWGEAVEVEMAPGPHPHEHHLLLLDPKKAMDRLGWRPGLDIDATVRWIVRWFKGYRDGADLRELTLDQIRAYQASTASTA